MVWFNARASFLPEFHRDDGNDYRSVHGAKETKLSKLDGSIENGRPGGLINLKSLTRTSSFSSATGS